MWLSLFANGGKWYQITHFSNNESGNTAWKGIILLNAIHLLKVANLAQTVSIFYIQSA